MITNKPYKNPKFHIDFADLEVELRKSIKNDQISEKLGKYIMKIVKAILSTSGNIKVYDKEALDLMEFTAYDYILRKLMVNYDVSRTSGYAFIKSMALNRIKAVKRELHKRGIHPEISFKQYNRRHKVYEQLTFLTIDTSWQES